MSWGQEAERTVPCSGFQGLGTRRCVPAVIQTRRDLGSSPAVVSCDFSPCAVLPLARAVVSPLLHPRPPLADQNGTAACLQNPRRCAATPPSVT